MIKKLAITALAAISLSGSAHAGTIFSSNAFQSRMILPNAPHNMEWYLRHGYTFASNISIAGRADENSALVFLVDSKEHPTSIIECEIVGADIVRCLVVLDPHYRNGKPIDAGQSQNNDG